MLKFINGLAVIEVNRKLEAIQLTFRGSGNMQQYQETIRIARGFANVHHMASYLLIKEKFDDISQEQFCRLLEEYILQLSQELPRRTAGKPRLALLLSPANAAAIHKRMAAHRSRMLFDVFTEEQQAHHFLWQPYQPEAASGQHFL